MIQMQTMLDVADNTGAKQVLCIKVLGGTRRRYAQIGDVIVGTVRKAQSNVDIKPGDIVRGVIVRTRKSLRREDGSYVKFDKNALVILDKEQEPKGSRIFGAVARELREKNFMKIIALAPEVV